MVSWQTFWKKHPPSIHQNNDRMENPEWLGKCKRWQKPSLRFHPWLPSSNPPPSRLFPWSKTLPHAFCMCKNTVLSSADKRAESEADARAAV